MQAAAPRLASVRTWRFPLVPLRGQLGFLTAAWVVWLFICLVITLWVAWTREITRSAWEPFTGIAPWFLAFQSGYVMFVTVPLFVAHGRTRNDTYTDWAFFAGILSAFGSLFVTIGYLLERALYAIGGWPTVVREGHLFSSHTDVGRIFLEYLLTFMVWTAAGGLVGIALYRWPKTGWLALIPASVLVGISGEITRTPVGDFGVIADRLGVLDVPSIASSLLVSIPCAVVAAISAWYVIRNMPLRTR